MSISITLEQGGTTYLGANATVLEFKSGIPRKSSRKVYRAGIDGEDLELSDYRNAVDEIKVLLTGGKTTVRASLRDIQAMFDRLKMRNGYRKMKHISPGYLNVNLDSEGNWRTEIIDATFDIENALFEYQWEAGKIIVRFLIERRPYYEGSETALTLSNGHGSGTTLQVDNSRCSVASLYNYADITTTILGDLRSPLILKIGNPMISGREIFKPFIGLNVFSDPSNFQHVFEANNTYNANGTLVTGDTNYTENSYRTFNLSGTGDQLTSQWNVVSAQVGKTKGAKFLPVLRMTAALAQDHWFAKVVAFYKDFIFDVYDPGYTNLNQYVSTHVLKPIPLPPEIPGQSSYQDMRFALYFKSTVDVSKTIGIDFLHLFPTDNFRWYSSDGSGVDQDEILVDDGVQDIVYLQSSTGGKLHMFSGYGERLHVYPGQSHRIIMLWNSDLTTDAKAGESELQASYRPRRMIL